MYYVYTPYSVLYCRLKLFHGSKRNQDGQPTVHPVLTVDSTEIVLFVLRMEYSMKRTGNRAQIRGGSDRSEFGIPTTLPPPPRPVSTSSQSISLFFLHPGPFSSEWIGVTSEHLHSTSLLDLVPTGPGAKSLEGNLPITQPHLISSDSALLRRVRSRLCTNHRNWIWRSRRSC